jgi:hypothetical protein
MTPVGMDRVPDALRVVSDQLAALGLTRATPPLAVTMSNPGILYGFVQEGGDVAASAFTVQPAGGAAAVTKRTPYLGPVKDQPSARAGIAGLLALPRGAGSR